MEINRDLINRDEKYPTTKTSAHTKLVCCRCGQDDVVFPRGVCTSEGFYYHQWCWRDEVDDCTNGYECFLSDIRRISEKRNHSQHD